MKTSLYIKQVKGKGRGVFGKERICKDQVFETAAVLVLPARDYEVVTSSHLADYFFKFYFKSSIGIASIIGCITFLYAPYFTSY